MQCADRNAVEPLQLELPASRESVAHARHAVARFAEAIGVDQAGVELAVSEAVGNAVVHAFPEGVTGTIRLRAVHRGDVLVVTVSDDGTGMRPNPDSAGLGLGLPLIGRIADSVHISHRAGGGTVVTMHFRPEAGLDD
jgi:anti-sigma regulatory factor (Ser/Thr protein kinase)